MRQGNFFRWAARGAFCAAVAALLGCANTFERYADEAALTIQQPAAQTQSFDIPKRFFDEILAPQWHWHYQRPGHLLEDVEPL